jgi:hypothetical protein
MIKVAFFGSTFAGRLVSDTFQTTRMLIFYHIQNASSRDGALVLQSMLDSDVEQKKGRGYLESAQMTWGSASLNYAGTNFELIDAT